MSHKQACLLVNSVRLVLDYMHIWLECALDLYDECGTCNYNSIKTKHYLADFPGFLATSKTLCTQTQSI